jgi:hypothetical protein
MSEQNKAVVRFPVVALLLALYAPLATYSADIDLQAFIGTWKQNSAKSRTSISSTLTYTFSQEADGFITIVRGGVQLRDRVRLDGKDYPTPDIPGRTVSWTKVDNKTYETTIKRNGVLLARARWMLSEDGKRLIHETTPTRVDDQSVTNTIEYVRTAGASNSLIGEWKPVASRPGEADLFVVTFIDGDALKVFYPRNQGSYTIRPDGKEYALTGMNALPDTTTSAEVLSPSSLRRMTLRAHTPIFEAVMTVSSDGKTLTVTTHRHGSPDQPSVFLYEKQY